MASDQDIFVAAARESFASYMGFVHKQDIEMSYDGRWGGEATESTGLEAIPFPHHMKMIEPLEDDSIGHTLIVAPRGSSKTTLIQGWLEWCLGRASLKGKNWAERERYLFVANTATQAYKISNAIKNTIEFNDAFHACFPKVKKYGEKWSEMEWRVQGNETQKDPTFQAMGITGPALGSRAVRIVLDDIGDKENMSTELQRRHVKETLTNTIKPILVPGGRMVMLATRWNWDDPPQWAIDQGWHTIYMKALITEDDDGPGSMDRDDHRDSSGLDNSSGDLPGNVVDIHRPPAYKSYWPERFPVEFLLQERVSDPRAFARQYQNEVAPEEGLVFERIWFEPRFDTPPSEIALRIDSWDTAAGEGRKRSFSVGLSVVVTPDWHIYIVNMLRGQIPYSDLLTAIDMTARRNSANAVIIEKRSSGHQATQDMRLKHLPIVEWQPFGQKGSPTRLEANTRVSDVCAQGRVHLPSDYYCRKVGSLDWLEPFEREVFSYPEAENDDVVDALAQLIYFVEEQRLRYQRFLPEASMRWGQISAEKRIFV